MKDRNRGKSATKTLPVRLVSTTTIRTLCSWGAARHSEGSGREIPQAAKIFQSQRGFEVSCISRAASAYLCPVDEIVSLEAAACA